MSNFGNKVFEVLDRIGKDAAWLAEQTGLTPQAISKWKLDSKRKPLPSNVLKVARALQPYGITREELEEAAGYGNFPDVSLTDKEKQMVEFMRVNRRAQQVWDLMQILTPDEVNELLAMNKAYISTRAGRRRRRNGV